MRILVCALGLLGLVSIGAACACTKTAELTTRRWKAYAENCSVAEPEKTDLDAVIDAGMRELRDQCIRSGRWEGLAGLKAKHVEDGRIEFPSGLIVTETGVPPHYINGETSAFAKEPQYLEQMHECVRAALQSAGRGAGCEFRLAEEPDETETFEIE